MPIWKRRSFLGTAAIALAGTLPLSPGDDRPRVKNPRATDGDERSEPDWKQRLTLTVGTESGDLMGTDDKVIQAAVDYVARLGGGTVQLLPGTFTFRNAVHLPSKIRLIGSGDDTVITRTASETIPLSADSDWYDQEITLEKSGDFRIGDGITLMAKNPGNGSSIVIKRILLA
ncbi:MAG: hypothetical protein ABGZ24_06555, partial [Fuerstiella sp.]